jgi:DNA-binding SARP family transcriptional activator
VAPQGSGASPADEPPILRAVPNGAVGEPQDRPSTLFKAAADHHGGRSGMSTLSTTLIEAGLLSAAVIGTLQIFRRRQAQHRPAGRRIRLPGPAVAATELALRTGEAPDQVDLVDRALHALVEDLRSAGMAAPTIQAVVAGPDSLELLIDRPVAPPPPWTSVAEGFRWRIDRDAIRPAPPDRSAPLPALAPVGEAAGGGSQVLINLEAAGMVGVTGAGDRAAGAVRAVTTALSGLPWAGAVDVVAVGFGQGLGVVEHVRVADHVGPLLEDLHARARVMRTVIGGGDPFHGRVDGRAIDGWAPTIVCCAIALTDGELASLAEVTAPGSGVLAIVTGGQELTSWTINVDGVPMAIHPLRLAIEPTVLSEVELHGVSQLYEIAQDDRGSTAEEPPYDRIELSAERSLSERLARLETRTSTNGHVGPELPSRPEVLIGVLGTVEIDGGSEFKRAKSRELAVYLALHPAGVGEAELDEAMWPSQTGRLVAASTRDSTVSVARTALGGPGRLLPAQLQGREKRYQVSPEVGTDWGLFCQLHRWGRASRDPARLRQALDLVRGRPFEGVLAARTYGWVHTEGHARHMEAEVGDAADLAAELLLASGQPVEARWAARRGLLADPYVERLWVRLMEAADQLGDSQEIERIMDEMDTVLELGGDFSSLHPQTLAAYDRLSRRHRLPR